MTAFLGRILAGDCRDHIDGLPDHSVDLIFADPPYNLQLTQDLWRPNQTKVDGVTDPWDQFESFEAYDEFTRTWMRACRRVLKPDGAIWVMGSYHNVFRLGKHLQDLGYWLLNDVIWVKTNPMPNFRGVRFGNAHETLIWAARSKESRYTFNHHAMKAFNGDKQMRSDWLLPICSGSERIQLNGKKAHSAQKPEALLYRVILSTTMPGDVVLDPFFGTGTTGVVAKKLHRSWIGIEQDESYIPLAEKRINATDPHPFEETVFDVSDKRRLAPRVPFSQLLEVGLISPGEKLYFKGKRNGVAKIKRDGKLRINGFEGSIHQTGKHLYQDRPVNGWDAWYFEGEDGHLHVIDELRERLRGELGLSLKSQDKG
jgi:modification methylase